MEKVTIKGVAKLANVSTATVSNVMNGSKYVQEETKNRVLKAIEELNYQPSSLAKSLKGIDTKVIGLVIPSQEQDSSAEYFSIMSSAIEKTKQDYGYQLISANSHEESNKERSRIQLFNNSMVEYVDGLIIAPTAKYLESMEDKRKIPTVFVDRKSSLEDYDVICTNNYEITLSALDEFVVKGYEEIILVSSLIDVSPMLERKQAFEETVAKLDIQQKPVIFELPSSFEAGYNIAKEVLSQFKKDKKALFISNNTIAMGMIKYFMDHNIEIPNDIGVLVYDDYPWMEVAKYPLTTIKQPVYEIGCQAAIRLIEKIKGENRSDKKIIEIPSKIVQTKKFIFLCK